MKSTILLALCLLSVTGLSAQEKKKLKYSGTGQFGLLHGNSDQAYQLQVVNGVQYDNLFAGIGIGLENYYMRAVPLFLNVRQDLFSNRSTPFVYADIGAAVPWPEKQGTEWTTSRYRSGLYYDLGFGYSTPLAKKVSFQVSAGYSLRKLHEKRNFSAVWIFPPIDRSTEYFDYTFRRLSLRTGIRF